MTAIEIEYCVQCNLLEPAIQTQTRLLEEYGAFLDSVTLIPVHGGTFRVSADGQTLWAKESHGTDFDVHWLIETVEDQFKARA